MSVVTVSPLTEIHYDSEVTFTGAAVQTIIPLSSLPQGKFFLRHAFVRFDIGGSSCDCGLAPAGVQGRVWLMADVASSLGSSDATAVASQNCGTIQTRAVHHRYRCLTECDFHTDSLVSAASPPAYRLQNREFRFESHVNRPGLTMWDAALDFPQAAWPALQLSLVWSGRQPYTARYSVRLLFQA